MKFGVTLPLGDSFKDPAASKDFAQAVEGLGYDYVSSGDHVVGAHPDNRPEGWRTFVNHMTFMPEPLVLFAYLGAVTTKLEFATSIIILPQRQTVLVAKQAAQLDYLLGGRLRLGFGIGWNTVEYESLNEDFTTRGRRVAEQIEVLRALWTQEVVEFHGRWHHIDRAGVNPMPVQRPIPIWMGGGHSDRSLRRIATIADGWIPLLRGDERTPKELTTEFKRFVREAGRQESDVGIEGRLVLADANPEDWQREFEDWRALGATHFNVTSGSGSAGLEQHLQNLRRFRDVAAAATR
jgi:probable F420-dependent oxidoreductase